MSDDEHPNRDSTGDPETKDLTPLEKIEQQIARLEARRDQIRNRERERERKLDARRKIILGGALLDRASAGNRQCEELVQGIVRDLGGRDAKVFEGWTPPGSGGQA